MNGQQLTNSSNSANGTPSSSYPASLSSQSSRDPSPATRPVKPPSEPFNHVISAQPNHWPKDKSNALLGGLPDPTIGRPGPQLHRSAPLSSPAINSQPPPTLHQSQPDIQNLQTAGTQPVGAPPNPPRPSPTFLNHQVKTPTSSSQLMYRQPPSQPLPPSSTTQTMPPVLNANHLPQPNSIPNQFPRPARPTNYPSFQSNQPVEPPRSTQSPVQQTSSQFQTQPLQPSSNNQFPQHSSQFKTMPSTPFQQSSNQTQNLPVQTSRPYQFSQSPNQTSQSSNQIPPVSNKLPPAPEQTLSNQTVQPQNQFSQPQYQFTQSQNQFNQSQSQLYKPPNPIPQSKNQFPQPPGQYPHQMPPGPPHSHTHSQTQYTNSVSGPTTQQPTSGYQQPPLQQIPNQFNKRYPQMPQNPGYQQQPGSMDGLTSQMAGMTVQQGFNKLWGMDTVDLLKSRDVLPKDKIEPPAIRLQHELYEAANCSSEIFRCTLTKIPETKSLLDKSRLPLGVLIHPFKDLNQLSVIQCTVIVRCRMCRTYINPFVYFVDNKRWKCNLCFRVNELPDEFQFDPMTKTYGDPSRRPEIKSATIEFIAPSEYMVRPPQPAIYVFVLDVSRLACECGYLDVVCRTLLAELDNVPGDARTSVAFITFDSAVHFYSLTEGQGQPHQLVVVDIDDMFLPTPDNLLVSLNECRDLIKDLLTELPNKYRESYDTHSALGAALQAAYKLLAPTGGRVTIFQACLPNVGPGALTAREDPAQRAGDNPPHLNPSTDFYKKLALDCSGQQIAVDLFLVNSQYLDLATLSGVSRFSGGCMHHVPLFRSDKPFLVDTLERMFQRYLTRKIGFESVMRLRCTRGLSIHTFHGNFFVRSTDLLSLPNANPDAGFGMQVTIDENLTDVQNVCFQAALLYTSSKGERRIRVHTLCLPVASNLADILHGADQQCIVGLLAKMAVDRCVQSSLSDAREAFVNVVADIFSAYKLTQSSNTTGCMLAPASLRLLPLYILALLKYVAFRVGQSTRLDDRVFAMCQMKSLPLTFLIQAIYPDLYPLLNIEQQPEVEVGEHTVPQPPRLQLSAERIDSHGIFLLDDGSSLLVYVGHNLEPAVCQAVFAVPHFSAIPQELYSLPEMDNSTSEAIRSFVTYLQNEKPYPIPIQIIRDDSHHRMRFLERLVEDKNESGTSYYEFLQRVKTLIK
uniref:Uncharacterized protein n=1 Tax=Graphocephala atropunctata TaxID=36148 RepID=A0A1B6M3Q4_9HEMI